MRGRVVAPDQLARVAARAAGCTCPVELRGGAELRVSCC